MLNHPWVRDKGVAPDKPIDSAVQTRLKQFSAMIGRMSRSKSTRVIGTGPGAEASARTGIMIAARAAAARIDFDGMIFQL